MVTKYKVVEGGNVVHEFEIGEVVTLVMPFQGGAGIYENVEGKSMQLEDCQVKEMHE